jgi:hypothetical protein
MARTKRFNMLGYSGNPMRLAGFRHPVVVDLASLKRPKSRGPILKDHDPLQIVGHWDTVSVSNQLRAFGIMSGVGKAAQAVAAHAANGFPWAASIGAGAESVEFVDAGKRENVNGQQLDGPLYVARGSTLAEISVVVLPADAGTSMDVTAESYDSGPALAASDEDDSIIASGPNIFAVPFGEFRDKKGQIKPYGRFRTANAVDAHLATIKAMCNRAEIEAVNRPTPSYPIAAYAPPSPPVRQSLEGAVPFVALANTGRLSFPYIGNGDTQTHCPTAFDLASLKSIQAGAAIPIMAEHVSGVIGYADRSWVDQSGLWMSGKISRFNPIGEKVYEQARRGKRWGASLHAKGERRVVPGHGVLNGIDLACRYGFVVHALFDAEPIELSVCQQGCDRDAYFDFGFEMT